MRPTFFKFALRYRDEKSPFGEFVEGMLEDTLFPRQEKEFDELSRYVEESIDVRLDATVFDEMYRLYDDRLDRVY